MRSCRLVHSSYALEGLDACCLHLQGSPRFLNYPKDGHRKPLQNVSNYSTHPSTRSYALMGSSKYNTLCDKYISHFICIKQKDLSEEIQSRLGHKGSSNWSGVDEGTQKGGDSSCQEGTWRRMCS